MDNTKVAVLAQVLPDQHSMLEEPLVLMKEALRILKPNAMLAVIHWNCDPTKLLLVVGRC